jgi:prolyl-tRNA editing enzyme YbaK/EbsC (Cys-tRNA(Pro) deacylase)
MPNADSARAATGYERGTIAPFGSLTVWPVVADARVTGTMSIGAGAHGVSATVSASELIRELSASVDDVTDPVW